MRPLLCFLSFASTSVAHGTQRMEIFRCTNGLGAGHSWSSSTFCSMATCGAAAAHCPAKSETSSGPYSPESSEDVGYPPICGTQCQVGGRQGTRCQVGESIGRHGRYGRSRGRVGPCSPQACTRGSRVFLLTSKSKSANRSSLELLPI